MLAGSEKDFSAIVYAVFVSGELLETSEKSGTEWRYKWKLRFAELRIPNHAGIFALDATERLSRCIHPWEVNLDGLTGLWCCN